ncbi:mRNA splicing protein prp28, partial [Kickxella alabastrina]
MEFNRFSSRKGSCDSDGEINERSEYVNPFGTSNRRAHPQPASASTGAGTLRTRASRIPLSVEEAQQLQRRQQPGSSSGSEPAKPVFLSKAQRAQLALEQRQREAAEVRQRRDSEVRAFQRGSPADADATDAGERRERRAPRRRSRSPEHSAPVGRAATHRAPEHSALVGRAGTDGSGDRVLTELERQAIRQRYLAGDTTAGRRQHRQQGGRRVVFEWDAAEDTSRDISDLYERRALPPPRTSAGAAGILDDRHWSAKSLGEMRDRDWRIFREDFGISCKGGAVPQPLRSWRESAVPEAILHAIADIGYVEPTPIQRQAIPVGLQRRDLIGLAETGSGKTSAFLVPLLANIVSMPPAAANDGPYALVRAPTRELALQIDAEAHKFARRLGVRSVSIVGGHDIEAQAQQLRRGAELVIATPGRLRDVLERRMLVLGRCGHVVMDEADRMIDMGFEDDVNFILDALPPRSERPRQTTMFSATMPPPVERLARKYLA